MPDVEADRAGGSVGTDDAGRSERWENGPAGRMVITVLIVVSLSAIVSTTMPASALRDRLTVWASPYVEATGTYQNWAIFSPNPRQESSYVIGRVDHQDGEVTTYPIVVRPGFPFSWDYRWQKFEEGLWLNPKDAWARAGYAQWVVARDVEAGHQPSRVTLVRRSAPSLPPGSTPDQGPWRDTVLFTQTVTP